MRPHRPKLLICDSDADFLRTIEALLSSGGYAIQTESEASAIVSALATKDFDFVLLDVTMAELDVLAAIDGLVHWGVNTAIVCVSDVTHYDLAIESVRRGAFDFLVKPYNIKSLPELISCSMRDALDECAHTALPSQTQPASDIYQFMIENSQDIQYLLDQHGRFVFINERVESLLGYTKSELIGQHFSRLVYEDDLAEFDCFLHEEMGNQLLSRSNEFRFKCKNKHGNMRYFDIKSVALPGELYLSQNSVPVAKKTSSLILGVAHDVTARKKVEQAVNRKASYDYLTGLPNKFLFYDRLNLAIAQAKRDGGIFAVMFLDLDGFKSVNDRFGHKTGDRVLLEVGSRLRECLREGDTLARVGGDEFIFLLPRVNNKWEAAIVAKKLTAEVSRPFHIDGQQHQLSVSVGISLYPEDGSSSEPLIHGADQAMYQIKHREKNGYQFFHPELSEQEYGDIPGRELR